MHEGAFEVQVRIRKGIRELISSGLTAALAAVMAVTAFSPIPAQAEGNSTPVSNGVVGAGPETVMNPNLGAVNPNNGLGYYHMVGLSGPNDSQENFKAAYDETLRWFDGRGAWLAPGEETKLRDAFEAMDANKQAIIEGQSPREVPSWRTPEREVLIEKMARMIAIMTAVANNPNLMSEDLTKAQQLDVLLNMYNKQAVKARAMEHLRWGLAQRMKPQRWTNWLARYQIAYEPNSPDKGRIPDWAVRKIEKIKGVAMEMAKVGKTILHKLNNGRIMVEAKSEDGRKSWRFIDYSTLDDKEKAAPDKFIRGIQLGYWPQMGVRAFTFWALVLNGAGMISAYQNNYTNPISIEQRLDYLFDPATIAAIGAFFPVQDGAARMFNKIRTHYATNRVAYDGVRGAGLMNTTGIGRTIFSGAGMGALSAGLFVSGLIGDFGHALESCRKMVSAQLMNERERQKHKSICDNVWEQWHSGEIFWKYAPQMMSIYVTIVLARIAALSVVGAYKGAKIVGPKLVRPAKLKVGQAPAVIDDAAKAAKGISAKGGEAAAEAAAKGWRAPIIPAEAISFLRLGGTARIVGIAIQVIGSHPVLKVILNLGGQVVIIYCIEQGMMWANKNVIAPAKAGRGYANAKRLVEESLVQVAANNSNSLKYDVILEEGATSSKNALVDAVHAYGDASRKWREAILVGALQAYNNWVDFLYKASNRFHAAKKFYRDVVEQVIAQRAASRQSQFVAKRHGETVWKDPFDSTGLKPEAWMLNNIYQKLPLFRSNPLYGIATEPHEEFTDSLERKAMDEAVAEAQKENPDYKPIPPAPFSVVDAEELNTKLQRIKEVRDWLKGEITCDKRLLPKIKNKGPVECANIRWPTVKSKVEKVVELLSSKNYGDLAQAIIYMRMRAKEWDTNCALEDYMTTKSQQCVFHEALSRLRQNQLPARYPRPMIVDVMPENQRTLQIPNQGEIYNPRVMSVGMALEPMVLDPGVKYIMDYDGELDSAGIDTWTFPEGNGYGHYYNMSHWLVTSMVCGPDVFKQGGKTMTDPLIELGGFAREWVAPKVVKLNGYCDYLSGIHRDLGNNWAGFLPSMDKRGGYGNIVELLYKELPSDGPFASAKTFNNWWELKINTEWQNFLKHVDKIYQEYVIDAELRPVLKATGTSFAARNIGFSGDDLPNGVANSMAMEMNYYFDHVLGAIIEQVVKRAKAKGEPEPIAVDILTSHILDIKQAMHKLLPDKDIPMEEVGMSMQLIEAKLSILKKMFGLEPFDLQIPQAPELDYRDNSQIQAQIDAQFAMLVQVSTIPYLENAEMEAANAVIEELQALEVHILTLHGIIGAVSQRETSAK